MTMKINYRVNNKMTVQVEPEDDIDAFKQINHVVELFDNTKCGKCGCEDVSFKVRTAKDEDGETYEYPEIVCQNHGCWAKLKFGQGKNGLFPVRFERKGKKYVKDDKGNYVPLGANGWVKYNKETGKDE